MTITDQKLSAFLDAELPENEMELVRIGIEADENLAIRLAELAMVDEKVVAAFRPLEQRPIPEGVTDLFTKHKALRDKNQQSAPIKDNIIRVSFWKRTTNKIQQYAAAAIICVLIGYGFGQLGQRPVISQAWIDASFVLDTHTSGQKYIAQSGDIITPNASFVSQQGYFCRQFKLSTDQLEQVSLACKQNGDWQLKASIYQQRENANNYQTASSLAVFDQMIDHLIDGSLLNRDAENKAIKKNWQSSISIKGTY